MSARLQNINAKAAELTHRRRVAEGDVLLDRPETFERAKPVYQKVVLPPRNTFHYWQPFIELGVFVAMILGFYIYMHMRQEDRPKTLRCSAWFSAPTFRSLLPPGDHFESYARGVHNEVGIHRGRDNRAVAILMVASSSSDVDVAADRIAKSYPPICKDLLIDIRLGGRMPTERLQQTLTQHVAQHNFGVFFIRGFEEATAADIRLLTAALRVRGELDGHAAHAAVFYLLMTAPAYAVQGVTPEAFHTAVAPYLDQHLLEVYRNGTSPGADAADDRVPLKSGSLRGSGSLASDKVDTPADAFATAFKQGVGFVVPIVV